MTTHAPIIFQISLLRITPLCFLKFSPLSLTFNFVQVPLCRCRPWAAFSSSRVTPRDAHSRRSLSVTILEHVEDRKTRQETKQRFLHAGSAICDLVLRITSGSEMRKVAQQAHIALDRQLASPDWRLEPHALRAKLTRNPAGCVIF